MIPTTWPIAEGVEHKAKELRQRMEQEAKATRRERIATAAMQSVVQLMPSASNEVIARQAAGLADALIAELDRDRP
jgi:hypothetical protein